MGYAVVKFSVMADQGQGNTDQIKSFSGQSPLAVTLSNGQTYNWGPNQSITLPEPYCDEAVTFDNRLKIVSRS